MSIKKIVAQSRLFDGEARMVIFPNVDCTKFNKATLLAAVLVGGVDCGPVVDGSGQWEGDNAEIEVLRDTEGGVIRSKDTAATYGYSLRVPHSEESALVAGAKIHTATSLGDDFKLAQDAKILGLNPKDLTKHCPACLINLAHNELQLFPRATVVFSPTTDDDSLREYEIKVQAEDISTKHLSTMMFIPLGEDPLADEEDSE